MANGKKVIKTEGPVPNFLDQANALIDKTYKKSESVSDPDYRPGLNIIDHKLWISVMDLHVKHVNEIMCKSFIATIAEHYEPIMRSLASLEKQQATIVGDIKSLKEDLTELSRIHYADVNEINSKLANDQREIKVIKESILAGKKRVDVIEEEINLLQPDIINKFLKRIDEVTPTLEALEQDQKRILDSQKIRNIAKRISVAVAISALITWFTITIAFNIHNRKTIEILEKLIPKTELTK